jgi:DNA replication protein DnaC
MSPAVKAVLMSNLKTLKLATMLKQFDENVRQASESKVSYEEFLLNLTEIELAVRKENSRQRRIREANFPLLKPLETFNFSAAPDLDARS